jgi:glucose-1-phosphate thymidylyltransferase
MQIKSGILLAGGTGSRLAPLTGDAGFNKHMLPVHNKFIIDYSLQTLIDIGCENITVILGGDKFEQVVKYLKSGSDKGVNINYTFQDQPLGIAHAINLCEPFIKSDKFAVVLGDNIFSEKIHFSDSHDAQIVLSKKDDMERFGVASLKDNKIFKMQEKPKKIDYDFDNYAITGCYLFDQKFFKYFKEISPSSRGEYEVVGVINKYFENNNLGYTIFDGMWSDAGVFESINYVNNFFYEKSGS